MLRSLPPNAIPPVIPCYRWDKERGRWGTNDLFPVLKKESRTVKWKKASKIKMVFALESYLEQVSAQYCFLERLDGHGFDCLFLSELF